MYIEDAMKKGNADLYGPETMKALLTILRHCLPVFVQPSVDCQNGNGLCGVVVSPNLDRKELALFVIYEAEASYNWVKPTSLNRGKRTSFSQHLVSEVSVSCYVLLS